MLTAMIVEDNVSFRKLSKGELSSRFPSMQVIEAENGEEVFKGLASYPLEPILMDIGLLGQNGFKLTRNRKVDYQGLTITAVSSYDFSEYREVAIQCGASCLINKSSFNIESISTFVSCFQKAKGDGRLRPTCLRLVSGEFCI